MNNFEFFSLPSSAEEELIHNYKNDIEKEDNDIKIFDFGELINTRKDVRISKSDFIKKYGEDLANECLKYAPEFKYPKDLGRRLCDKIGINKKRKTNTDINTKKFKGRFLGIDIDTFTNIDYLRKDPDATKLHIFLMANEITYKKSNDNFNIYQKYFLNKRLIATIFTLTQLKEIFGVGSIDRVVRWVTSLEKNGAIIKNTIYNRKTKQYNPTVFILGYVDDEGYYNYLYGNNEEHIEIVKTRLQTI